MRKTTASATPSNSSAPSGSPSKNWATSSRTLLSAAALAGVLALALVTSCSTSGTRMILEGAGQPSALTREAAAARSKMVGKVAYALQMDLRGALPHTEADASFTGTVQIRLELKPKARDAGSRLFIDFSEGTLQSVQVNGKAVKDLADPDRFDGHKLWLELNRFNSSGENLVEIAFSHPFSKNGSGLHRFVDPEDKRVYTYSDFEPYDAHRMFPCFDQPDLKATYELQAIAPAEWTVISNTREVGAPEAVEGEPASKKWTFPKTEVFSTYLFSVHAGPYKMWQAQAGTIPMRLFSRRTVAKFVEPQEWFEITRKGLEFYATTFGYPYPFHKYDQIIVPDFNPGAMENVAAVTFNEDRFTFRTKVTQDRRRGRAEVILHEMAHQWFGDLVTMRWWNGLWLNESFATFMAGWATDRSTRFKGAWQSFFSGEKTWAYWEDQLVTTHPIEVSVADTEQAMSVFDGITYGKGASVLKQLFHYVGEDEFKDGLQRYFIQHAFKNTSLADFIKMLSEASGRDLSVWQKQWLQTAGVNVIETRWSCEPDEKTGKSMLKELALVQLAQSEPGAPGVLRGHKTKVALFKNAGGKVEIAGDPIDAEFSGPLTPLTGLGKRPCPEMVFANFEDHDYAKLRLDPISQDFVQRNLSKVSDRLTRQMLWHTLWSQVVDGISSPAEYAKTVFKHAAQEQDTEVLDAILNSLTTVAQYTPPPQLERFRVQREGFLRQGLAHAASGSDLQLVWYMAYVNQAWTRGALTGLRQWLDGKSVPNGIKMDQERRWQLLRTLVRASTGSQLKAARELLTQEIAKDPSDAGVILGLRAQTAIADLESKKEWFEKIRTKALPVPKIRAVMRDFYAVGQEELTQFAIDPYFERLAAFVEESRKGVEDATFMSRFSSGMFPSAHCSSDVVSKATAFLAKNPQLPVTIRKAVLVGRQETERCIRARGAT